MRFLAYFSPKLRIGFIIMACLSLVGLALGIAVLAGARIEASTGQATLLISVCSLTFLIATLFATIHYKVDDNFIHINIAFIDMTGNRIRIDNILNILIDNDRMYISYLWQGPDPVIALLAISPKRFNEMKDLLMSKNKNIVFNERKDETSDCEQ
ncbi:MAG: hypothetical protein J1F66_04685 [Clostridiales bacterium]|nr:hypothetical protein [Clostridiales bacterium]